MNPIMFRAGQMAQGQPQGATPGVTPGTEADRPNLSRRGFLAGILAAGVAPAAVGSGILMPVRQIIVPQAQQFLRVNAGGDLEWFGYDPGSSERAIVASVRDGVVTIHPASPVQRFALAMAYDDGDTRRWIPA